MICENIFCIYQDEQDNECILEEISLNNAGMCADCIYINIDDLELQRQKNKILNRYEDEYNKYNF